MPSLIVAPRLQNDSASFGRRAHARISTAVNVVKSTTLMELAQNLGACVHVTREDGLLGIVSCRFTAIENGDSMFNKNSILTKYGPATQTTDRDPTSAKLPSNPFGASDANSHGTVKAIPSPAEKASSSAAATADTTDDNAGSRLVVGPNVKLKGAEIDDCDILVVEGRVEATMDSRVLRVAQNGAFSGKVGIDIAEIRGRFDGELTARSQLIIHATGRVNGTIRYGKILVEEGGELSGDIRSLASSSDANGQERADTANNKTKNGNLAH